MALRTELRRCSCSLASGGGRAPLRPVAGHWSEERPAPLSALRARLSSRPNTAPTGGAWRKPSPGLPFLGVSSRNFGRGFGPGRFSHSSASTRRHVCQDRMRYLANCTEAA